MKLFKPVFPASCFMFLLLLSSTTLGQKEQYETHKLNIEFSLPSFGVEQLMREQNIFRAPVEACIGEPFEKGLKGMTYFNPANPDNLPTEQWHEDSLKQQTIQAFRFYQDTSLLKAVYVDANRRIYYLPLEPCPTKDISDFMRPFYFKNHEVNNAEYKIFVDWVRDSIARCRLIDAGFINYAKADADNENYSISGYPPLNWEKPIHWDVTEETDSTYKAVIASLFCEEKDRFMAIKKLDCRQLIYQTQNPSTGKIDFVAIYPDTLCWLKDFASSYGKTLAESYFWHPAYDAYPVTGINWYQAKAFCYWKTQRLQEEINQKNLPYTVTVDLPYDYEWEYVGTGYQHRQTNKADVSYLCDLMLKLRTDETSNYSGNKLIRDLVHTYNYHKYNYIEDGFLYTYPADISELNTRKGKRQFIKTAHPPLHETNKQTERDVERMLELLLLNLDQHNISGMGGNVSEWMNESYEKNWLPMVKIRKELIDQCMDIEKEKGFRQNTKTKPETSGPANDVSVCKMPLLPLRELAIQQEIEAYYQDFYTENFSRQSEKHLVRGANFLDERYSTTYGQNLAGIHAKTFASANSSHATLGFRYVVRVKKK